MARSIYVDNSVLVQDKKFTYLSGDVVAGAQAIGLQSTVGFHSLTTSSGQVLLIGELGQEKAEIIRVDHTSTSSGTNISGTGATLRTVLRFSHPQDTKVTIIDYDRFEIQHASTVSGTKATITVSGSDYPSDLQADQLESLYRDTVQSSGFYFVRFVESIGSSTTDWSDAIPYAGYNDNTVHEIKKRALESIDEEVDDETITQEFLDRSLWQLRRDYHQKPGKRPFRRSYNADIGNVTTGMRRVPLPIYVEKPHSAENVYSVRIGTGEDIIYYGKKEWDSDWSGTANTTLSLSYTAGTSTSIWLADGRDFSGSASINILGSNVGCTRIVGELNSFYVRTHGSNSAGTEADVYENASFSYPRNFTVFADVGGSSYIYFSNPIETAYVDQNIYADYYRTILQHDSDADEMDEPDYDMYVPGLAWKIKKRRNPQLKAEEDDDWREWMRQSDEAHRKEYGGVKINLVPNIDHLL